MTDADHREFAGKVAIVTGASRGIGRAVASMFAARGAALVLVGRDSVQLGETAADIEQRGGQAVVVRGDVANGRTATEAVGLAQTRFGRLDILANIAGAYPTALLTDTDDEMYAQILAANLTGTFVMSRAALPIMLARGGGAIVNMSSTAARLPTPGLSIYGASKAAVEAFTRAVAAEAAPSVRVNAVSAGPTRTEAVDALMQSDTTGAVQTVTKALPLQRLAEVDEIAECVLFLASDKTSFVTGQVLHANGGGIMA